MGWCFVSICQRKSEAKLLVKTPNWEAPVETQTFLTHSHCQWGEKALRDPTDVSDSYFSLIQRSRQETPNSHRRIAAFSPQKSSHSRSIRAKNVRAWTRLISRRGKPVLIVFFLSSQSQGACRVKKSSFSFPLPSQIYCKYKKSSTEKKEFFLFPQTAKPFFSIHSFLFRLLDLTARSSGFLQFVASGAVSRFNGKFGKEDPLLVEKWRRKALFLALF